MSHPVAKTLYRITAFAALPGTLWSAFEMYGLTLRAPQMLFFSIIHTMVWLPWVVLVGLCCLILWVIESATGIFLAGYREKIGLPARELVIIAGVAAFHLLLLFSYDLWSGSAARIAICVLGISAMICLLGAAVTLVWTDSSR